MAKKKTLTIAQLVEKAAVALQLYVRVKATDDNGYVRCVTCGVKRHYKDQMQGGHYIERTWTATKLMEENVHPQCSTCNGGFGGKVKGNPRAYTKFMIDTYGREFTDELEVIKNVPKKYYRHEVEEIIQNIKQKTREIQEEKGI